MSTNVRICLQCAYVTKPPYLVKCPCTIDNIDITEHLRNGDCPKGYFSGEPQPAAPVMPCTGCGKPDPTTPYGSKAAIQNELGGL